MDPAPAGFIPIDAYQFFDYLIPNETEAEALVGHSVQANEEVIDAAKTLLDRGVNRGVIIKLGSRGAFYMNQETSGFVAAPEVAVIDTVAAGDAFNAGFAVALTENQNINDSIAFANATAGLSTTKVGTASSMPLRSEIDESL